MDKTQQWQQTKPKDFWAEIAPCEHVLQIYESNEALISTLAGFVGDGINVGDCTIVIATKAHRVALEENLKKHGINVDSLIGEDRYIPVDADDALSLFMRDGWPDREEFFKLISGLFKRARAQGRNVRAFGEMVAILWAEGKNGATVQLEDLWNQFCQKNEMTLFCAYPRSGFTVDAQESINHICATHSKVISGHTNSPATITFKNV